MIALLCCFSMLSIASMTTASVDVVLEKPIPGNALDDVETEVGLEKLGNALVDNELEKLGNEIDVSSC